MLSNLLGLFATLLVVLLFSWITWRAWHARARALRWVGTMGAGALTIVLALLWLAAAVGLYKLYAPRSAPMPGISVSGTPEQVARGEHLAAVACAGCHAVNGELPLSGGRNLSDDAGLPLGDIYAPNLTTAGITRNLSDAELARAIRYGVDRGGQPLLMPTNNLRQLSDDDVAALIAYLRKSPPVQTETPDTNPSLLLALFVGTGLVNTDTPTTAGPVSAPPKAATAPYGQYIVGYFGCGDCHGAALDGNSAPPAPPAPNLRAIMPRWTKDEFFKAMRTGIDPTGHAIQPPMPWQAIGKLDDVELEALFKYLNTLPPS